MAVGRRMRSKFAIGCFALVVASLVFPSVPAATTAPLPQTKIEQAVIDSLPAWHGKKAQVIGYLDLTQPFATVTPWSMVIAQAAGPVPAPEWTDHGPIKICFVGGLHSEYPQCTSSYWQRGEGMAWFARPYSVVAAQVVFAGRLRTRPLLLVQTCSIPGINGNCSTRTSLYAYVSNVDGFRRVFVHDSDGSNNNQAARFVESGPLQRDVIVDYPTDHAPYTYWIEVYAPSKSGQYTRIVRYRGHTGYGDGNPLPVADSEMPGIMERLGRWKPGNALPVPAQMPEQCGRLVMRNGEEWCQNLCVRLPGTDCGHFARTKRSELRHR